MFRTTCFALAASFASSAIGQAAVRSDPSNPKVSAPARPYVSAFEGYRPYADPDITRWREVNDEVGKLKGHAGHVPPPPGTATKPEAKPAAQGGHGGHK